MPENLEAITYIALTKRWLSPDDMVIAYGFSKSTLSKYRMEKNSSDMPYSKIGGKYILYDRVLIDLWIEEHKVQGL